MAYTHGEFFGKAFEHFVLMELIAYNSYNELDFDINFWRTKSGLEVDFILGNGEIAIEIKGSGSVDSRDLYPLKAFLMEFPFRSLGRKNHQIEVDSCKRSDVG